MKIAVIGAGAIGSLVAGYLKNRNLDVYLVAHPAAEEVIRKNGLCMSGVRGNLQLKIDVGGKLTVPADLVILATKTHDLDAAIKENLEFLRDSTVLTTQNGVAADEICARYIPEEKIISSIVMFGSTSLVPGEVVHNFEGEWIIGRPFGENDLVVRQIAEVMGKAFKVSISDDLSGMKHLKVFVNANNCIPAILGLSMQESFSDIETAKISIAIWKEGLSVVGKAGIGLVSLPDFPLERVTKLTSMPTQDAAGVFLGIMKNLSEEPLYGSILQSIKRGKSSEIDYINGEFVDLAAKHGTKAPLNEKLVNMVHQVEHTGNFFSREELLGAVQGLID